MYRIDYNPDLHLLEITMVGFFTEQGVAEFVRDLATALAKTHQIPPPSSLYNYTDAAIQSQSVVLQLQAIARRVQPGRRIALYTEGRLARLQARRIAAECPTMVVFDDRASAIAWLQSPSLEAAA